MLNEMLKEKELKDNEKIINAIHKNCKDTRMNRLIDEQLKQIKETEKERYYKKWNKILFISLLIGLILEIVGLIIER